MNATPHVHRLLLAAALALSAGSVQAAQTTGSQPIEKADPAAIQPDTDVPPPQPISDEVIGQEYDAYRQSVKGQKMYTVSYILLDDETEARQWIARLRSGASFEKAAREHSRHPLSAKEGGKLGTFATCRWAKDTVQMLDTLKPGQIHAKPVKASAGWSIYRLDAVRPLEPISYAQYKEQLLSGTFKPECPWVPPVTVGVPREP
ncbi:MAG: peptidylprolyl isomerase [Lautropia mirabilis]|nr:peptidylprolyl isomerase [Lautropia mirabilis]